MTNCEIPFDAMTIVCQYLPNASDIRNVILVNREWSNLSLPHHNHWRVLLFCQMGYPYSRLDKNNPIGRWNSIRRAWKGTLNNANYAKQRLKQILRHKAFIRGRSAIREIWNTYPRDVNKLMKNTKSIVDIVESLKAVTCDKIFNQIANSAVCAIARIATLHQNRLSDEQGQLLLEYMQILKRKYNAKLNRFWRRISINNNANFGPDGFLATFLIEKAFIPEWDCDIESFGEVAAVMFKDEAKMIQYLGPIAHKIQLCSYRRKTYVRHSLQSFIPLAVIALKNSKGGSLKEIIQVMDRLDEFRSSFVLNALEKECGEILYSRMLPRQLRFKPYRQDAFYLYCSSIADCPPNAYLGCAKYIFKWLIDDCKMPVNYVGTDGETALSKLVNRNRVEFLPYIEMLLQAGATCSHTMEAQIDQLRNKEQM